MDRDNTVRALPVAFIVWAIGLSFGDTTGSAIDPARDFAPRVMHLLLPMGAKKSSKRGLHVDTRRRTPPRFFG